MTININSKHWKVLALAVVFLFFILVPASAEECIVQQQCDSGYNPILRLSSGANAHVGDKDHISYNNILCCPAPVSVSNVNSGDWDFALSASTNAHIEFNIGNNPIYEHKYKLQNAGACAITADSLPPDGSLQLLAVSSRINAHVSGVSYNTYTNWEIFYCAIPCTDSYSTAPSNYNQEGFYCAGLAQDVIVDPDNPKTGDNPQCPLGGSPTLKVGTTDDYFCSSIFCDDASQAQITATSNLDINYDNADGATSGEVRWVSYDYSTTDDTAGEALGSTGCFCLYGVSSGGGADLECNPSPPNCGDGILDTDEECDDGNTLSRDGCDSGCRVEIPPVCGDGIEQPWVGEECDDGKQCWDGTQCTADSACPIGDSCIPRSGDGCDSNCKIEATADTDRDGVPDNVPDLCPNTATGPVDSNGCSDSQIDADGDLHTKDVDCDDTDASINPDATEVCEDNVDNNCDFSVNENCDCSPQGSTQSCGTAEGVCQLGNQTCQQNNAWGAECLYNGELWENQKSAEVYDGLDNDCDGEIDEGLISDIEISSSKIEAELDEIILFNVEIEPEIYSLIEWDLGKRTEPWGRLEFEEDEGVVCSGQDRCLLNNIQNPTNILLEGEIDQVNLEEVDNPCACLEDSDRIYPLVSNNQTYITTRYEDFDVCKSTGDCRVTVYVTDIAGNIKEDYIIISILEEEITCSGDSHPCDFSQSDLPLDDTYTNQLYGTDCCCDEDYLPEDISNLDSTLTGDEQECAVVFEEEPECTEDSDCSIDEICSNGECIQEVVPTDTELCGNGVCDLTYGENSFNCIDDCHCGDGICQEEYFESTNNCPQDCQKSSAFLIIALILIFVLGIVLYIAYSKGMLGSFIKGGKAPKEKPSLFEHEGEPPLSLASKHNVTKPSNSTSSVASYIRSCRARGFSYTQIKKALLDKGWKEEIVNKVFGQVA